MIFNSFLAFLSLSASCGVAAPLLGGVTGALPGLTGTHLSGSGVVSTVGNVVGSATSAGTHLGSVSNTVGGVSSRDPVGALTGTVSSVVGSVPGLLQAKCDTSNWKCTVTMSGEIENLLTDGGNFTGKTTISAWMKDGHAYGSAQLAGTAPLPFNISCDAKADVCLGTLAGNVTQVFTNGKQVALWGWATPSGNCKNGTCTGSITTCGDPGYKMKRRDLC